MKKIIKKIRFWILKKLFTDDEKYLIIRAIEDRIGTMDIFAITEKYADKDNIYEDYKEYHKLKEIFSTKEWI